ncbi:cell division protein FtsQ/DivIB [Malonomonas rubra]|nr:FtsQ-type POTRA domain-containing protein [Malonomonas rubra]
MRDLKKTQKTKRKVRQNRKKGQKKSLPLRKILHRALRVGVVVFSGALMVVGSFLVVQLLLASDMFRVDQVSVAGGAHLSDEQIIALSDVQTGLNTFELDLDLIGNKIAENPWVRTAQVQRVFPRQIDIRIEERKPVAIINLGYLYYLDEQGEVFKVLDADDSLDYPVVTGFDYQKIKQCDSSCVDDLERIVALLQDLKEREQFKLEQISEINRAANGRLVLFTLDGGVKIRLGHDGFGKKLDRLEQIYAELKPRLSILDYIDLNVDEKVIVRIERPTRAAKG